MQLICGGGIHPQEQIAELRRAGCKSVLLGTSLHRGLIGEPASARLEQS